MTCTGEHVHSSKEKPIPIHLIMAVKNYDCDMSLLHTCSILKMLIDSMPLQVRIETFPQVSQSTFLALLVLGRFTLSGTNLIVRAM